jgi:hypothetical protein
MRRIVFLLGLVALSAAFASQAAAGTTTVSVSMTLTEPLKAGTPGSSSCPDIGFNFNCGSGEVIPFGHATEEANLGVCGDTCSIREIDLSQGSIILQETVTGFSCPGVCGSQTSNTQTPFALTISDTVIDGTGIFDGATGSLSGTVVGAGWEAQIKLSGTITLQT